jgi:predicted membrane protein DUF2207
MLDIIVAASSVGLWFAAYAGCRVATRTTPPPAGPPTMDLGREPPAVVSMLVNGWSTSVDTAESTVLDLAAAHYFELRQPDEDPFRTTIHLTPKTPDEGRLRPYERQVLDRIRGLAVGGVVPVTALSFRDKNESRAWNKKLRIAVVAEARAAGLSERRFGRTMMKALFAGALAAGLACGFVAAHATHATAMFLMFIWVTVALVVLIQHIGERATPAGLEATFRWLGVRAWLRNHEQFAELPPSAVSIWDRYLAYGAALGVTRRASAVLDLEVGDRRKVWSSYRSGWRRVRVSYPSWRPWHGKTARALVRQALLFLTAGAVVVLIVGGAGWYAALGYVLLASGFYVLIRTVIDQDRSEGITGEVIWKSRWRPKVGRTDPRTSRRNRRPWLDYLAIDDGAADETTAWGLPSEWGDRCHDGDVVTVTVRPWSRLVIEVVRHSRGRSPQTGAQTGTLVRDFFGVEHELRALPVSVEDVSRVVGQPVRPEHRQQGVEFRSETNDAVVLRAEWASGMAGRIAWRANGSVSGTPLPGIGDEAYLSKNHAVMRTGDVTLVLAAVGSGRTGTPHLPWLLSRAVIPAPTP